MINIILAFNDTLHGYEAICRRITCDFELNLRFPKLKSGHFQPLKTDL